MGGTSVQSISGKELSECRNLLLLLQIIIFDNFAYLVMVISGQKWVSFTILNVMLIVAVAAAVVVAAAAVVAAAVVVAAVVAAVNDIILT